jgi:hypothetical protein
MRTSLIVLVLVCAGCGGGSGGGAARPVDRPAEKTAAPPPAAPVFDVTGRDGVRRVEAAVTPATTEVLGVSCAIVEERVFDGAELMEMTFEWFAQDRDGNVWAMGEDGSRGLLRRQTAEGRTDLQRFLVLEPAGAREHYAPDLDRAAIARLLK